jgi:hypothetical protein
MQGDAHIAQGNVRGCGVFINAAHNRHKLRHPLMRRTLVLVNIGLKTLKNVAF